MARATTVLEGTIINPFTGNIFYGKIHIENGRICSITSCLEGNSKKVITCGLIDSHVHIESSLLPPREYARLAVRHGVVGCLADPHEIANVCGLGGVEYMIESAKRVPFHFFWGAPSCVPATAFETAGGKLGVDDVKYLLDQPEVTHLAEVMNWPAVIAKDDRFMQMIKDARKKLKAVDAHAPGLNDEQIIQYFSALGIASDHECFNYNEAVLKLNQGAKIAIREGSAAKNFDALIELLLDQNHKDNIFFCADDAHPDFLSQDRSYIHQMIRRALDKGVSLTDAVRAATRNPILHYDLAIGRMRVGDWADLVVFDDLNLSNVLQTYAKGMLVYNQGTTKIRSKDPLIILNFLITGSFSAKPISKDTLRIKKTSGSIRVIGVKSGELITEHLIKPAYAVDGYLSSRVDTDVLKYVMLNRYEPQAKPAIGFVHGMGIRHGAIASSVSHDSHNIGCIGVDDESMTRAINLVIKNKGGLSLVSGKEEYILPLPIAGLMSDQTAEVVAEKYTLIDRLSKDLLSSPLPAPFMALSFLGLTVIPSLKLSDLGLFDGNQFKIVSLEAED